MFFSSFRRQFFELGDGVFEVLSTDGDTHLGGDDVDEKIINWLADEFKKDETIDLRKDPMSLQRLKEAAEKGVLAIGNVINTQPDYPDTVIASAIWNMEATIDRAVSKVASGSFEAEDYGQFSFMKYGGGNLAPYGTFEYRIPAKIKKVCSAPVKSKKSARFMQTF